MNRQIKLLATVSLLLNLLLAGIIIGHAGHYFLPPPHRPLEIFMASLPEERRPAFQSALKTLHDDNGELHEKMDDARKKAAAIIAADPFDREAYLAQTKLMEDLRAQMMRRVAATVAELAANCTPQERAQLAEALRHSPSESGR